MYAKSHTCLVYRKNLKETNAYAKFIWWELYLMDSIASCKWYRNDPSKIRSYDEQCYSFLLKNMDRKLFLKISNKHELPDPFSWVEIYMKSASTEGKITHLQGFLIVYARNSPGLVFLYIKWYLPPKWRGSNVSQNILRIRTHQINGGSKKLADIL